MHEMTSVGSTRCQLASVCFELAPTVTEKTWSSGSLDCRSERNMSATVSLLNSGSEKVLHTFVCEVIAQAEHELRWLVAILEDEPLCDLALVDESGTNFKVGFACHDFYVVLLRDRPLEMLLALASLECSVLGISSPIVPGEGNLLAFDEGSYTVLATTNQGGESNYLASYLCNVGRPR
jgi:hypothetical protein